ncbi:MAG: hypothetical protein LQ338_006286 [Usnochroma carphineum]|nr:MAG: hypothetical protein LQ338_006286 [Usnochroma carphineum]
MADDPIERSKYEREQRDRLPLMNGVREETCNQQVNGDIVPTQNSQANLSTAMGDLTGQLPPDIEHITFGYLPFSQLITRLVQETFNGFTECINDMSEIQMPQVNGVTAPDTSHSNVQKKLRLLNYAQERRAQFIKILVLSRWSRQAESISRVIDMKLWLDNKRRLYDDACNWMGELKRIVESERIPNPDLKTALEALSMGKAPGLPDLGYIPPKPLSPQQLLKAIRGINTQLTLRLHLHETIPPAFRDFSVANGRATFRVPDEFEIDLSIAKDDLSSQLYFIDFRFTFQPTPAELPQGSLRNEIEGRVNELLCREGLAGCYRFLHDFVLSHKLNILRQQAYRLSQENWSEHLKVEAVHRALVIQYWISRPGGKNWIEIGVRRRKVGRSSWFHQDEDDPHIGVRWFRAGKEMNENSVTVDLGDLSVENILRQVISAHTNSIFKETLAKLREGTLYSRKLLRLKHTRSTTESANSRLSIQLTASQSCTIIQEPVTGRLALLSPSLLNSRAERELNSLGSPEKGTASCIAQLRAVASCEEAEQTMRRHGWEVVNTIRPNQESLRQRFGNDTSRASFFRKRAWNAQWLLAFTAGLAGDVWWIMELNDATSKPDPIAALGPSIKAAFRLPTDIPGVTAPKDLSSADLSRVERTAAGLISQFIDTRQLSTQQIPHRLVPNGPSRSSSHFPTLYVHFPKHRAQKFQKDAESKEIPWSSQNVRISLTGIDTSKSATNHLVIAQTSDAVLRSSYLSSMIGGFIKFHPASGDFAFRLSTPVGQSTIPAILERLARIQRLMDYIKTLQAFKLKAQTLSLDHLEFVYANTEAQDCRAKISFTVVGKPPQLSLNYGNPHLRIQDQLMLLFRKSNGLHQIIRFLQLSLPLMQGFAALEAAHTNDGVTILPRSAEWYQVRYRDLLGRFDVRLRQRRGNLMWFVQPSNLPDGEKRDQRVQDQLDDLLKGTGEGWLGVKQGIAASLVGVEAVLKRIDEISQQHVPTPTAEEPAETVKKQDFKGQKRKAEDDAGVVVLD